MQLPSEFCCLSFKGHAEQDDPTGEFRLEDDGSWSILADPGANAVNDMKFCPFCGSPVPTEDQLSDPPPPLPSDFRPPD